MAQIFVSHSAKDIEVKNFFNSIFSGLKVNAVFEEYESLITDSVTASKIQIDIAQSSAVFMLITQNVNNTIHTRDWVVWEAGVAKDKPLWVFELYDQFSMISVIIPNTKHYVVYYPIDPWFKYIHDIVSSYDNSAAFQAATGAALVGALANPFIALAAGVAGLILSDRSSKRPQGRAVICPVCNSSYNIHLPEGLKDIRCPVCNNHIQFLI